MKKTATLLIIFLASINLVNSQTSGGPDAFGYVWRDSNDGAGAPVYNWIDITPLPGAQNVRFLADDNTVGSFPIGFPFHYYWYDVSQFWVGSNGYIGFTNGQISSPFPIIPSAAAPNNFIAAMASDLMFGSAGNTAECWRWSNPAHDTLIVSYINVPFYLDVAPGYSGNNTFQIILSGVDSSITFQYQDQQGTTLNAGNFLSVGIENNSGIIGLQNIFNTYPPTSYAIKFYYPSNNNFVVNDASTEYNDNPDTGGKFLSKGGNRFTMTTNVKNTGNQSLAPFNVFGRVFLAGGGIQPGSSTVATTALAPGQSQTITMTNTFNPVNAGTYTYNSTTQLSGDATSTNNTKIMELHVVDTTAASINLSYDSGNPATSGIGLTWTGGQGGGGVYFVPPFYPVNLTAISAYILSDFDGVGFSMEVFRDNGIGGSPGTMLDSQVVAPGSSIEAAWNVITLPTPIPITSGGVYVSWTMNGTNITLGLDDVTPFSNRTFEVIGNTWATYRSRETMDLMINATIEKLPNAGIDEASDNFKFGEFYPNPSSGLSYLNYDFSTNVKNLSYQIYDIQGKLVEQKNLTPQATNGKLVIHTETLKAGIYNCKLSVDGNTAMRKLVVVK